MNSLIVFVIVVVLVFGQDEADTRKSIGQRLCAKDYVARPDREQGDKPVGVERPAPADLDETNSELAGLDKRVRDLVLEQKQEREQDVLNAEARRKHWEEQRTAAASRLAELQTLAKKRFYETFCSRLATDAMLPSDSGSLTDLQRQRLAALAECAEKRDTLQPCSAGQQPIVEGQLCYQCIPTVTRTGDAQLTDAQKEQYFAERLQRCTTYCESKTPADECNVQQSDFELATSMYQWGCKQTLTDGGTTTRTTERTWGDADAGTATNAGKRQDAPSTETVTDRHTLGDAGSQTTDWSSTEEALRERWHREAVNATVAAASRCAQLAAEFGTQKRQDNDSAAADDSSSTDFCAAAKALFDAAFDCRDKIEDAAAFAACREDFVRQLQIQDLEACRAQREENESTLENRDRDEARKHRAERDRDAAQKVADAVAEAAADAGCSQAAQQCRDWRRACRVKRATRDAERAKTGGIAVRTDADNKPLAERPVDGARTTAAATDAGAAGRKRQRVAGASADEKQAPTTAGDQAAPVAEDLDCSDAAFRDQCHGYRKCLEEKAQAKQVSVFERCVRQEKKRVAFTHVECFAPDSTDAPVTDPTQAAELAGQDPATKAEIVKEESFEAFSNAAYERIDKRVRDFCNATRPVDDPMPANLKCLCDSIAGDQQLFFKTETYEVKWFRSPEQMVCKLARCQCTAASLLQRFAKCDVTPPTVAAGASSDATAPTAGNKIRPAALNGDDAFTQLLQAAVQGDSSFESVSVVDAGTDTTLPLEVLAPVDQLLVGYPDDGATVAEEQADPLNGESDGESAAVAIVVSAALALTMLALA